MKKIIPIALGCFCSVFLLNSCSHDSDIPSDPKHQASFQNDIAEIISSNCTQSGCHDANAHEEAESLVGYSHVMHYVVAGDAHHSKLYEVISDRSGEHPMPPDYPLTNEQVKFIYLWIEQGAQNN